uniref:Zinc finger protein 629 n=1 Tax=Cacopsylla melanoneura TaxID=428564 RepID=A0A8D9A2X1_9HEMI
MNMVQCPVCTLYLREGITLKEHLDTHPKDKVIEALVSSSEEKHAAVVNQPNFQNSFIQSPFQINNHVANPMQFSIIQPNPEQIQTAQGMFVPNIISNRRYIVSQPGPIRGFQRQTNEKVFTALPAQFCNQIITAPQYASSPVQIPARTPQPHILTSNTQNINTHGGPAIIYSQLPQPVQNVPNVHQAGHFQGVQNFQAQAPVVVPQSSSISSTINTNAQFGNSSLESFTNTTITPVQSNKTTTTEISQKETQVVQVASNTQEFCNASTQVTSVPNNDINTSHNDSLLTEQYENKMYEVLKDDTDDNEQYEYIDDAYELDAHYTCESNDDIVGMKEEPEYLEDDKSIIGTSTDDDTDAVVMQYEQNKQNEDGYCENDDVSTTQCNELTSNINIVDNRENNDHEVTLNAEEKLPIDFEEDLSSDINAEMEDLQSEEILESKIDIVDNYYPLESKMDIDYTLESTPIRDQVKEVDLSKSSVKKPDAFSNITVLGNRNKVTISCVSSRNRHDSEKSNKLNTDNKRKKLQDCVLVEENIQAIKKVEHRNQVSISCVNSNVQQSSNNINKAEAETKRKGVGESSVLIQLEESQAKRQKLDNQESSNLSIINSKPSPSPLEGIIPFRIQEVMYELKAFGNTSLAVHKLDISNIQYHQPAPQQLQQQHPSKVKKETSEDVVEKSEILPNIFQCKKPMPSTSSTPDVTVQLISKIKTEPVQDNTPNVNKAPKTEDNAQPSISNVVRYNPIQRGRLKKPVKILQIKNAKKKDEVVNPQVNVPSTCSEPSQSSVIQHPIKTEPAVPPPPPLYDSKHGVLYCQPGSSRTNTLSDFPAIDILPVSTSLTVDRAPSVDITPSKFLPSPIPHSPSLHDYTDLVANTKLDRLTNLHHSDYDSVDTPHWLLRGINILPQVVEDDRISCASPKTLLNLDHQTSFETFEPEDSGSTSINMQTDEMMPPRGELSGQESLESSVWGYQEDNGAAQYRQWDEIDHEVDNVSNSNTFRTKIEKVDPMELLADDKIKLEETISTIHPMSSNLDTATKKKHACIYCKKTFPGWKLRKYHMKAEHPELFNEPETAKLLTEKVQASTSSLISEPSTSFVSQTSAACPIKFENSNSFGTQDFLPPSIGPIKAKQRQCVTCSEIFDKLKPYQDHIRNVHPLICPLCSKTFLTKPNLTIHMRTHLKIKPYKCDVCEKSFVTAQKLSDHKNTHTGNAPFPCNMCDRHFKRYSNLAQHKKVIHLKKKKTKDYYCHCGEIFQSRGKLLWHQETHASVPKQCTYCTEKFTHTSSLTRHIRKNHDACYLPTDRKKTDENVSCDICKIVVLKSTLKSHMRIHDTSKPFACTVCKKSFYTKWNLGLHQWTHVSRTHMPFKCKSCNRGFYSANEYQAHLRSHRNIRPYTCNYCGRKFIRKFNCIRHVREHEAKKKYNCTVCGKTFHRSYYLTAHVRVHNGERPFSCHICGKTSTTKSNHNKHVKTHHARETVNTEG